MTNSTTPQPVQEPAGAVGDDLRKLRFIYRVLSNFAAAPQSDRGDAYAMVRELIESTWNRGRDASPQAALLGPAGAVGIALDALEKLNERPRPMCRDCADNPDDLCPNSGLPCDMRKCIADARSALASLPPVTQVKSESEAVATKKRPPLMKRRGFAAEAQGVFRKFKVTRTDGSSAKGGKHHDCEYFVLDVDHDPYAKAALTAYATVCEGTHKLLALDMRLRYDLPDAAPQEAVERQPLNIDAIIREVSELPDRSSPEDWPKAMLVTAGELRRILTEAQR